MKPAMESVARPKPNRASSPSCSINCIAAASSEVQASGSQSDQPRRPCARRVRIVPRRAGFRRAVRRFDGGGEQRTQPRHRVLVALAGFHPQAIAQPAGDAKTVVHRRGAGRARAAEEIIVPAPPAWAVGALASSASAASSEASCSHRQPDFERQAREAVFVAEQLAVAGVGLPAREKVA